MIKKILLLLLIFIISSCSTGFKHTESEINTPECMPLLFPQGFVDGNEGSKVIEDDLPVEPGKPWRKIEQFQSDKEYLDIEFIVSHNDTNYIYLRSDEYSFKIYDTNRKKLHDEYSLSVSSLIQDSYGIVWSREYSYDGKTIQFTKHEPETNKRVSFSVHLPEDMTILHALSLGKSLGWIIFSNANNELFLGKFPIVLDVVAELNYSHLFDNTIIGLNHDDRDIIWGLAVDSEDNAYAGILHWTGRLSIIKITPEDTRTIAIGFDFTRLRIDMQWFPSRFYFDSKNRLWVGDYGWVNLGFQSDIYPMGAATYRSPVFLSADANGAGTHVWDRPVPTADTPDGRIWYKSVRGTAWHQPETGEWCMFSTSSSGAYQDSEGNLWLVYDNALYMLPASETRAKDE